MINKDIEETKSVLNIESYVKENIHLCVRGLNAYKETGFIDAEDDNPFYVLLTMIRKVNSEHALKVAESVVTHHALLYIEHESALIEYITERLEKHNDQ